MANIISADMMKNPLVQRVEAISGQNLALCYQCGKCSATCPSSSQMDVLPHLLIRYLQMGFPQAFDAKSIWLCATCFSCESKCPRGLDVGKICEALRVLKLRKEPYELKTETISSEVPQQGLVSAYRKLSSY